MVLFNKDYCKHDYENIGKYYKEHLTEYINAFDKVSAYKRYKCKYCGDITDELISIEKFKPIMVYNSREKRRDEYIEHLKELGYKLEIDL